jgi:hypothetical protein
VAPPKKGGALVLGPAPAPPTSTKNLSTGAAFNAFINAHPTMRGYADQIYKYAKVYGVDPVVMAALYWRESFAAAKASGQDPATIVSSKGAVGIGQIMPLHVGEKTPWGHIVSQSDLTNPKFNIQWSTWYFSTWVAKYGNYDEAYAGQVGTQSGGYNHGYSGPALTSLLPNKYVPRSGLSPTDKGAVAAETAAATAAAKTQTFDKWAVLDPKGKVQFVNITDTTQPPKNVLKYAGTPLTQSTFTQTWGQNYADTFEAYTGRRASGKELAAILEQAPSTWTLANQLAQQGGFSKSPVYKSHAPGLVAIGKSILGNDWKPSGGIIRNAIAQSWDQATFEAALRKDPAYLKGPEFKTNLAQNQSVAEGIYGRPDGSAAKLIKDVTIAGWSPTEFATWLRKQPAYQQTAEYQSKVLAFVGPNGLGLITGAVPTLSGAQVDQSLTAEDNLKSPATAASTPATPPVVTKPAPELVSEHGQGGGWGPQ